MNPISFLTQMLRIAIPYLFAASGGVIAERAGIISLELEGLMLTERSRQPWERTTAEVRGSASCVASVVDSSSD
jgi:hypothetical protein